MDFDTLVESVGEVGYVQRVSDAVVQVAGLPGVRLGEMVMFESGRHGVVTALADDGLECLVISRHAVHTGTRVARTNENLKINIGPEILGRAVNVLGEGIDGGQYKTEHTIELDIIPSGIVKRKKIGRPLYTGLMLTDLMVPIGRGQRELVMGDRKTGKSYFLLQTILAQAEMGTICIYAAIGKKRAEIMRTIDFLVERKIMDRVVVIAASSQDGVGEVYLAPYTAMAIAEYFRDLGKEVLVVLDDMASHAKFYRQLSLISRKFPGRDSYPGDIFHVQSKLLERAGNFVLDDGREVAITCLPVVETVQGDVTGYIQTNLMSMTDGHVYFDNDLFFKGRRPAINPFISVTRVGYQTQSKLRRDVSRALYDLLNNYERTQNFLRFGSELGENSRQILALGQKVLNFFDQPFYLVVPPNLEVVSMSAIMAGVWDGVGILELVQKYNSTAAVKSEVDRLAETSEGLDKLYIELRTAWGGIR